MKVSLIAPLVSPWATPGYVAEFGRVAEECGFHGLWVAEHTVLFDEYQSRYPYSEDGQMPAAGDSGFLETFTALSFLAGQTKSIRLGSGVCIVPQRNPVYTAKEAAAVDWLSGGRLDFGVGIGWLAEEFRSVAAPFERRGARCRSYLQVIKRLWMEDLSAYHDEFYDLPSCRMNPKPVQKPHPPIYFGGESVPALRRVADLGQGWFGLNLDPEQVPPALGRLDALLTERGRQRSEIDILVSPYFKGCDRDKLTQYRDLGVDQVAVPVLPRDTGAVRQALETLAEMLLMSPAGSGND